MSRIRTNLITNRMANGAPTVSNGLVISGVTTVTTLDLNGDLDVDGHTNLDNVNISGISSTGNIYITTGGDGRKLSFAGDGSSHYVKMDHTLNGPIINGYGGIAFETNGTNERLRIAADSNITQTIDTDGDGFIITAGDMKPMLTGNANRSAHANTLFGISGKWNNTEVGRIAFEAGPDTTNKDDGYLRFYTTPSGGSLTRRITIDPNGQICIGSDAYPRKRLDITGPDGRSGASPGNSDTALIIDNDGGNGAIMEFLSDNNAYGRIFFTDTDTSNQGQIVYNHSSDSMTVATGGTNNVVIVNNVIDLFQNRNVYQRNQNMAIADGANKTFTITGVGYGWAKLQLAFYGEGQYCNVEVSLGGLMAGGSQYYSATIIANGSSGNCGVAFSANQTSYVVTISNNVGNGGSLHGTSLFTGSGNSAHPNMAVS